MAKKKTPAFHPGRREHAEQFVEKLSDPKSRAYAGRLLDAIWWQHKRGPVKPRGLSVQRVKEIDAALYAIFATIR